MQRTGLRLGTVSEGYVQDLLVAQPIGLYVNPNDLDKLLQAMVSDSRNHFL